MQVALCSNTSSVVGDSEGKYIIFEHGSGNSVDKAVVRFAMLSLGIRKEYLSVRKSQTIIKAYPFDSRKKFSKFSVYFVRLTGPHLMFSFI